MLWLPVIAALGLGAAAVVYYWDDIKDWLRHIVSVLKRFVIETIRNPHMSASTVLAKVIAQEVAEILHKLYYKENNQWYEKTTTRSLPESELPSRIRNRIARKNTEYIIDDYVENELGLDLS